MEFDRAYYQGKTAIVTGAASGVGLALIEALLESGAEKTVLADFNRENLTEHEARLEAQYPGRVKGILCDVTDEQQVISMIHGAADFFGGKIDLLFNNAGKGFFSFFEDTTNESWEQAFALNFFGALYGMRAALPIMQGQGGGQIVNIISGIAFMPMAMTSQYAATKAALNALTIALRSEYWDDNIKINSATPGTTVSNIWEGMAAPPDAQPAERSAAIILSGVAKNDRITFGSDGDMAGGANGANYSVQHGQDAYLLRVARERRRTNSFYY